MNTTSPSILCAHISRPVSHGCLNCPRIFGGVGPWRHANSSRRSIPHSGFTRTTIRSSCWPTYNQSDWPSWRRILRISDSTPPCSNCSMSTGQMDAVGSACSMPAKPKMSSPIFRPNSVCIPPSRFTAEVLGILAGDHCKEASDLGVPLVGIGFMYPQGYFRQRITAGGLAGSRIRSV